MPSEGMDQNVNYLTFIVVIAVTFLCAGPIATEFTSPHCSHS